MGLHFPQILLEAAVFVFLGLQAFGGFVELFFEVGGVLSFLHHFRQKVALGLRGDVVVVMKALGDGGGGGG